MKTPTVIRVSLIVGIALLLVAMPLLGACTKEVVKEVPVEKVVVKEVPKEVIKEVPVEKVVEREVVKEVPIERVVEKEVIKEVPVERVVIKEVEAKPKAAPTSTQKVVHLEVRTAAFGGSAYLMGFALADILNKNHPWIRATAMETFSSNDNFKTVAPDKAKRARTIFMSMDAVAAQAEAGLPPFDDKPEQYKGWRVLSATQSIGEAIITTDPNITSLSQLAGKKFGGFHESDTKGFNTLRYFRAAGIADKVDYQVLGWGCIDALMDGKVDAAYCTWTNPVGDKWVNLPAVEQAYGKKKIYVIPFEEELLRKTREMFGDAAGIGGILPANSVAPGFPDKDKLIHVFKLGWLVFPEFPEEVAYQVVKTIAENYQKFAEYHAGGARMSPQNIGAYPFSPDHWHPGSRRYLDEKGLGYGADYLATLLAKK